MIENYSDNNTRLQWYVASGNEMVKIYNVQYNFMNIYIILCVILVFLFMYYFKHMCMDHSLYLYLWCVVRV